MLADCWVMRAQDMGVTDAQYHCRTHLGHILKAGDSVLGFDMTSTNVNDANLAKVSGTCSVSLSYTPRSHRKGCRLSARF